MGDEPGTKTDSGKELTLTIAIMDLGSAVRTLDKLVFGDRPKEELQATKGSGDKIAGSRNRVVELTKVIASCNRRLEIL